MPKISHKDDWGYSDSIRLLISGETKELNDFTKEFKKTFPTEEIENINQKNVEIYVTKKEVPYAKKLIKIFNLKIAFKEGGATDSNETARIILSQLGGQGRLVAMTGANNFSALKNGVAFRIKNRSVNYIRITLNANDLYDVIFGKIIKYNLKVISEHKDIYNDQLIPLFEKQTGMYLKFEKGGGISIADTNPYIAGAKAVQGIAPKSVSAFDTKMANRINPDPNRPVFFAKGGVIVTSISEIPNFKQRLEEGKISYRGMAMADSKEFYKLAGEGGTRIKVDGKEYYITDTEFNSFSRGADGRLKIRFEAPVRRN